MVHEIPYITPSRSSQILYSTVHDNGQILLTVSKHDKYYNADQKKVLLRKIADLSFGLVGDQKLLGYEQDDYFLFMYKQGNFLYSCITGNQFPKHVSRSFLQDTATEHLRRGGSAVKASTLQSILKEKMRAKNDLQSDPLKASETTLQIVKREVVNTVDRLISRGDAIDTLNNQAEMLMDSSYRGQATSQRIRVTRTINRYSIIVGVLCLIVIVVMVALVVLISQFRLWGYWIHEKSDRTDQNPFPTG